MAERNPIFTAFEKYLTENPGKTLKDYRKETGYDGPALKQRQRAGQPPRVSFKGSGSYDSEVKRREALQTQDLEYIKTWEDAGFDKTQAMDQLKKSKSQKSKLLNLVRNLNLEHGKNSFTVGHITAANGGGGDFDRNRRLERGKGPGGNFSRSNNDELPDSVKPALGVPRSGQGGRDAALMDMDPEMFDLGLTPLDRQKIRQNPKNANIIITARQQELRRRSRIQGVAGVTDSLNRMQGSGSDIVDRINADNGTNGHATTLGVPLDLM